MQTANRSNVFIIYYFFVLVHAINTKTGLALKITDVIKGLKAVLAALFNESPFLTTLYFHTKNDF